MANDYLSVGNTLSGSRQPFNYEKIEIVSRDFQTTWFDVSLIREQLNNWGDTSQDDYLQQLDVATRMAIEDYLGMSIYPTQYRIYYGNPSQTGTAFQLNLPEATQGVTGVTINSVQYYNDSVPSVLTTIASSTYQYDPSGNQIILSTVPSNISNQIANPLVATYTTNANIMAQYPNIQQAGLLLLTHLYNNRANTQEGVLHEIPWGVATLLRPYKPLVM